MKGQGLHRRLSAFVVLLGIVRCAGTDRAPTCNSSHDPGMVEPVIIGGIGDSGTRGIRNLLELLGVRVCAATDKTGDDNGVQRATHRLLYGPRGIFEHVESHPTTAEGRCRYGANFSQPDAAAQAAYFSPAPDLRPGQLGVLLRSHSSEFSRSTSASSPVQSAHNTHDDNRQTVEDPYATYLRQLIKHHDYSSNSEGASSLCRAIAASHACARKVVPSRVLPEVKAAAYAASKAGVKWLDDDVWGFKEPRTAFFLKEFDELLSGHHARFVHVLRDGRDVALGDLRLVTSLACAAYFTAQHLEEDISLAGHFREKSGNNNDNSSSSSSILSYEGFTKDKTSGQESRGKGRGSSFTERFDTSQGHLLRQAQSCSLGRACSAAGRAPQLVVWALLNEAIADEALARFGPSRYFAIRVEDVALDPNPAPTIHALLRFLRGAEVDVGAPPSSSSSSSTSSQSSYTSGASSRSSTSPTERFVQAEQRAVAAVAQLIAGKHAAAYGGQKFGSDAQRLALLRALHAEPGGALLGSPGVFHEDSEGIGSSNDEGGGMQAVRHALVRFGYHVNGWGLAERAWSANSYACRYRNLINHQRK